MADFVAVVDTFVVDRLADIEVVVEKTVDSGAVRRVGMQRLDTRWFWSKWLQEVLPHLLTDAQVALLDPRHDFYLFFGFAPLSLWPNHQTSSCLLVSVYRTSRLPYSKIPLILDSDLQIPDFFGGSAGFALAVRFVSCPRRIQYYF